VGNLPSEDIVHFLNAMGIETGIETQAAMAAARDVAAIAGIPAASRLATVGTREDIMRLGADAPAAHPH
jgi:hydroxymethylglutaryl-CoA lyase